MREGPPWRQVNLSVRSLALPPVLVTIRLYPVKVLGHGKASIRRSVMNHTTRTRTVDSHAAAWCSVVDRGAGLTTIRSALFDPPERGRIAVKIVTATGMEMTAVRQIEDGCES